MMAHPVKVVPSTAISLFAAIVLERENLFLSFPGCLALFIGQVCSCLSALPITVCRLSIQQSVFFQQGFCRCNRASFIAYIRLALKIGVAGIVEFGTIWIYA